jgi:hypothetical protein
MRLKAPELDIILINGAEMLSLGSVDGVAPCITAICDCET